MSITLQSGRILIRAPISLRERIKALPGARWDPKARCWALAATRTAAIAVIEALGQVLDASDEVRRLGAAVDVHRADPVPLERSPAWRHQRAAFWFCVSQFGDSLEDA